MAAAFQAVPRHLFVPHAPLDRAYADDVVLMKRNEAGIAISSVSQPSIVALMLEQAGIRSGDHVLEIGSGGYNAALMRELAGPKGSVTTVDIDPEVTDRAREVLTAAGYDDVRVVRADGEFGVPEGAPYDRIVVTVTAWDIATAWIDQLRPGGRTRRTAAVAGADPVDRVRPGGRPSGEPVDDAVRVRVHAGRGSELRAGRSDRG